MTDRRDRGSGSLTQRQPGVWRLRAYVGDDPITGNPRQASRTVKASSKTDARKKLRQFLTEIDEGRVAKTGAGVTMSRLFDDWLKVLARRGRTQVTVHSYRGIIDGHLLAVFGRTEVAKVTARRLDDYYAAQLARGLAPGSVRMHHSIMSGALSQAVKWEWIPSNPASRATPPPATKTKRTAPTPAEVRRLLEVCVAGEDMDLATVVALAAMTGSRRSELIGLRWSDVDWETAVLTVHGAKGGGDRQVAIGVEMVAILARYRAATESKAAALHIDVPADGWLLSYDCGRTPMRPNRLSEAVTALGQRAGVPVVLHELRHFAGTQMVGAGVDVRTAAGRLGHRPEMLLSTYSHVIPERDRAAADMLEAQVLARVVDP